MSFSDHAPVARLDRDGRIALLSIDSPPVNALGLAVRKAIVDAVDAVESDPAVDVLVIRCDGKTFFAGADIREFGKPPVAPFLPDTVNRVEASAKPVIAAIHGTALGGGLEVAMGCHFRIAAESAKLGLPEVKLGLMPGAGGTQRLPRLVGIERALALITAGDPIGAAEAVRLGLLDRVTEGDLSEAAVAFAREIVAERQPIVRTSARTLVPPAGGDAFFDEFLRSNARKFRGLVAPGVIVEVVRAGLEEPFDAAVARERASFLALRDGPQSRALRHVFFAEREAGRVPGLPADVKPSQIGQVGVVGAGIMGSGIALALLSAGYPVILVETTQGALDRGVGIINGTLDKNLASGRMSDSQVRHARAGLSATLDFARLGDADLVIEAAFETMDVKREIFGKLDGVAKPSAILATNTSYLDVDAIAAATSRPEQVLGLHFFSPANIMKLLEIVRGANTSDAVLVTALDLAGRIGKIAVVAGNAYGFIGNRMLAVRRQEAEAMVLAGANPYDIDRVAEAFGMPMGPFRIGDLAGLDLGWSRETSTGSTIRERLCERDRRGQKTNAGYYDYTDGKAQPSDEVLDLIRAFAQVNNIAQRNVSDEEILTRLLYPMIDEGARILHEGKAIRASDIDVVWLFGYGWPLWTGGPMHYADQVGLANVAEALQSLGEGYAPSPLLKKLAESGSSFAEYDRSRGG